jgi:hypothetical protein
MFAQYDPLAQRLYIYGLLYPFIEIFLGCLYIRDMQMQYRLPINALAACMTGITTIGIVYHIYHDTQHTCACMGSKMTTPLGWPSLIEQAGMCGMALWMMYMMMSMGM